MAWYIYACHLTSKTTRWPKQLGILLKSSQNIQAEWQSHIELGKEILHKAGYRAFSSVQADKANARCTNLPV